MASKDDHTLSKGHIRPQARPACPKRPLALSKDPKRRHTQTSRLRKASSTLHKAFTGHPVLPQGLERLPTPSKSIRISPKLIQEPQETYNLC